MTTTWHHPLDTLERPARAVRGAGRTAAEFRAAWQGLTESLMDQITDPTKLERELPSKGAQPRRRTWRTAAIGVVTLLALFAAWFVLAPHKANQAAAVPTQAPPVTVSLPLQRSVDSRVGFLGQFSAIDRVELRAQVGGTLTEIHFKDGDIVHKGDLLFVIDPRPYEIKLEQAKAALADRNRARRARQQPAQPLTIAQAQ